jgi:hypothetical protein
VGLSKRRIPKTKIEPCKDLSADKHDDQEQ